MACLKSLPVELLRQICINLSCKDVLQLILVCRSFNTVLYSNIFQNVVIRHPDHLRLFINTIADGRLSNTSQGLKTKSLKLQNSPITEQQLSVLVNGCPHITELDVDSVMWLYMCPQKRGLAWNLRSDIIRHSLTMTFTKYVNLTSLSLNLSGYTSQTIDFHQVLPFLFGLKALKLVGVFHVFTMNDMERLHDHCPKLVELALSGFCLNRIRPSPPLAKNTTLRHLSLNFSSGWSYYYSWLWYIGCKYTGLVSLICECTATMGIRSTNPRDEEDMLDAFAVFAQQHGSTLQKLEFINLNIDIRLFDALYNATTIDTTSTIDDRATLMDWEMDERHGAHTTAIASATQQSKVITSARYSNQASFIISDVFNAILRYARPTIRTLNVSWPVLDVNNATIFESLVACAFLTDLALEIPTYMFGFVENQGTVPIDRILRSCPTLISLRITHGKIFFTDDNMASNPAHPYNHPLKTLTLNMVYIPTQFMVMENHGLLNLEHVKMVHCTIYGLTAPSPSTPGITLDWLFPIPMPVNDDPLLTARHRPLSISLLHVHFVDPETQRVTLLCDYLSLSQHGKGEEDSWCIRSGYVQKMVRMSSPMLRRKSGQVKRKHNRRHQVPSDYHEGDIAVTPKVGILISCFSMDSLLINGRELL